MRAASAARAAGGASWIRATSGLTTKVTTTERCIVITGEAATEAERSLAGKLAGSIRGVMAVTNNMTVKM